MIPLFFNGFAAIATFTTYLYFRRRRTWLMALLIALPALLPPFAAYYAPQLEHDVKAFDGIVQYMYLMTLAPLTALVYGCSLLSEEIEGRTLPLLLSRATPRAAIVLGKYVAFVFVSIILLIASLVLTYASFGWFLRMPMLEFQRLLYHYAALLALTLIVYGAFCVAASTLTRRPVVVSALFIFGWEKLVIALPGYADFLTIQKYVQRLLPEVQWTRLEIEKVELPPELMREVYPVSIQFSLLALAGVTVVLLALACAAVRSREFATAADAG